MAVTSQIRPASAFGEVTLTVWQKAGLLQPSVTKPILATIEKGAGLPGRTPRRRASPPNPANGRVEPLAASAARIGNSSVRASAPRLSSPDDHTLDAAIPPALPAPAARNSGLGSNSHWGDTLSIRTLERRLTNPADVGKKALDLLSFLWIVSLG
jgi:hypothetical protein